MAAARGILIAIGAVRLPLKAGNLGLEKHIAGKLAARKAYDRVFGYIGSGSYTPYNIRIIRLAVFGYGDASYFRNPRGIAAAVESGDKEAAKAELTAATKTIEMAASKGVYHKNNVARKISRLSKAVNGMA